MFAQDNLGVGSQPNASTLASRIKYFMRMNPPTFHGTNVDENPQGFINEVFMVVDPTGVTSREKSKLAAYQLNNVAQVWFEQWRDELLLVLNDDLNFKTPMESCLFFL